jgi:hypothetical protein
MELYERNFTTVGAAAASEDGERMMTTALERLEGNEKLATEWFWDEYAQNAFRQGYTMKEFASAQWLSNVAVPDFPNTEWARLIHYLPYQLRMEHLNYRRLQRHGEEQHRSDCYCCCCCCWSLKEEFNRGQREKERIKRRDLLQEQSLRDPSTDGFFLNEVIWRLFTETTPLEEVHTEMNRYRIELNLLRENNRLRYEKNKEIDEFYKLKNSTKRWIKRKREELRQRHF